MTGRVKSPGPAQARSTNLKISHYNGRKRQEAGLEVLALQGQNTDKTEEGMTGKDGKKNGSKDPPLQKKEKADSSGKEPPSE